MTPRTLELGDGLHLPLEAVTQTFGILAVRGAGKSNLGAVLAEQLYGAQLPFVVVDPVGAWWGLRSSADGKGPGLAVPIFGGRHGDVPLERTGGALLADLVVDQRMSCVLDLSEFSEDAKKAFLLEFARRLYRRNEEPLHLILEEADDYAPQRPMRDEAQLLRAWEDIVRRGRARGLGITMITQRSAALNKNLLTQIETLCVLRTTSPQDRKAIAGWVEYHGQAAELLESLSGLANGEAWIWSPSWLGKLQRIRVHRRSTFDSGATPKHLKGSRAPATLADVNLAAIRDRMAATIERAKAEDPRELRRQVAELKRQLADAQRATPAAPAPKVAVKEVPVLKDGQLTRIEKLVDRLEGASDRLVSAGTEIGAAAGELRTAVLSTRPPATATRTSAATNPAQVAPRPAVAHDIRRDTRPARSQKPLADSGTALPKGERLVLTAIAQYPDGVVREQLTVLTGYKRSTRDTYIQRLGERDLIEVSGARITVTHAGVNALGTDFEPLPTGDALRAHWLERLPEGERVILQLLAGAYPQPVDRTHISDETGYARSSRDTYLQRLGAKRLVVAAGRAAVCAARELFG